MMFVKVFKEASSGSDDLRGGVPIKRLMTALEDFGLGLTVAESLIWLERQDLDGTGTITLGELSQAIASAAAMKKELGV